LISWICYQYKLPYEESRKLDEDFVEFLFDMALKYVNYSDETFLRATLKCIFCVNMQFEVLNENIVMQILSRKNEAQHLGNTIVVLFNRQEDVLCMIPCLKFLKDLFSARSTSDFFFINDLQVLLDVIIRAVNDLPPGDELRPKYLQALYALLKNNPNYSKTLYKKKDILEMTSSLLESYNPGDPTFVIAEQIILDIPMFG